MVNSDCHESSREGPSYRTLFIFLFYFDSDMARQVFWAVNKNEVIPCHLIAKKDRDGRGKYAANSKRDKRRFQAAFADPEEAHKAAAQYEYYMSQTDTFQP